MNEKITKEDILLTVKLLAIIFGLIAATVFTGKALGIPEFQGLF